ncbi:hypothetical protein SKAU_G00104170 [Synaphobranchus kaupii]|uniref:Uncharacterized protein n=1 Tax=Synaphobranchus kaupii TaxID=118154 RepID=A0A9Q1FYT7_SYNKA|nr:hypothetical protein SKAU_G00104170 [Synaphobranchus kaupii]
MHYSSSSEQKCIWMLESLQPQVSCDLLPLTLDPWAACGEGASWSATRRQALDRCTVETPGASNPRPVSLSANEPRPSARRKAGTRSVRHVYLPFQLTAFLTEACPTTLPPTDPEGLSSPLNPHRGSNFLNHRPQTPDPGPNRIPEVSCEGVTHTAFHRSCRRYGIWVGGKQWRTSESKGSRHSQEKEIGNWSLAIRCHGNPLPDPAYAYGRVEANDRRPRSVPAPMSALKIRSSGIDLAAG